MFNPRRTLLLLTSAALALGVLAAPVLSNPDTGRGSTAFEAVSDVDPIPFNMARLERRLHQADREATQDELTWAWNARVAEIEQQAIDRFVWKATAQYNREAAWYAGVEAEQARLAAIEAEEAAAAEAAEEASYSYESSDTGTYVAPTASYGSGSCGGNLPPCSVMACESGGSLTVVNPSSGAAGKWQIIPSTWNGYGGYASAADAPESVQDARAAEIYAGGAGAGAWVCS